MKRITIGIALSAMALGAVACGGDQNQGPLEGVESIMFIERQPRNNGMGDIFQYQSYVAGARLLQLTPPTADGEITEVLPGNHAEFEGADILDFDISYDAKTVVVTARLSGDQRYGMFIVELDSGNVEQIAADPNADYAHVVWLPEGSIFFTTNDVVEEGAPQFRDEYERGTTLQLGHVNRDGTNYTLCGRNLSHRLAPTVTSTGRVMLTQWDHLGDMNAGHLISMNPGCERVQEAFGKEGTGVTNSYYKVHEISPGRVVAIASSRDMTLQSGTILDIRLGEAYENNGEIWADRNMTEENATYRILTPSVPLMDEPSSSTVGRYYNAVPLNAKDFPDFVVSWADGPVQSDVLAAAGVNANFGIYLYDSERAIRKPIYDRPDTWEINPKLVVERDVPPVIPPVGGHEFDDRAVLMGAMNVYDSSITTFEPGSAYGVRIIEGFSGEEGVGMDFGLTEHEGAALLGVAKVQADGSWAALIPPNIPVHQQVIDVYGLSMQNEPIWVSGNFGENMFCGGCHEARDETTVIQPGITQAAAIGPDRLMETVTRFDRVSTDFTANFPQGPQGTVGIPWTGPIQTLFDNHCVECHDGTPGPANPSYTITDPESGTSQTITFDLRGIDVNYGFGDEMMSGYTASHLSLLGPDMMDLEDAGLIVTGDMKIYVEPLSARDSELIIKLNPMVQYPTPDPNTRLFSGAGHLAEQGRPELSPAEMLLLQRMADFGGQFFSRENAELAQSYDNN